MSAVAPKTDRGERYMQYPGLDGDPDTRSGTRIGGNLPEGSESVAHHDGPIAAILVVGHQLSWPKRSSAVAVRADDLFHSRFKRSRPPVYLCERGEAARTPRLDDPQQSHCQDSTPVRLLCTAGRYYISCLMSSKAPKLYSVDVSDPRLVYEPAEAWGPSCSNGDTGTQTAGSSVTFTFNGTFVEVYGSSSSAQTSTSFVLDGQQAVNYASSGASSQDLPLYHSFTLNHGAHTLKITVKGDDPSLCLQQLQFTGTPVHSASSASSAVVPTQTQALNSSSTTTSSNHLSPGAICGIAISSIVVLFLVIFTILYACGLLPRHCRRGRRPSKDEGVDIILDEMPKSPPPPVGMDIFRKMLIQHAQNNAMTRLASGPNSKKSSSNGTRSTAIFSSVVILTPPVSSSGGSHGRSERQPQRPQRAQLRPSTPTLHIANQVQSP